MGCSYSGIPGFRKPASDLWKNAGQMKTNLLDKRVCVNMCLAKGKAQGRVWVLPEPWICLLGKGTLARGAGAQSGSGHAGRRCALGRSEVGRTPLLPRAGVSTPHSERPHFSLLGCPTTASVPVHAKLGTYFAWPLVLSQTTGGGVQRPLAYFLACPARPLTPNIPAPLDMSWWA